MAPKLFILLIQKLATSACLCAVFLNAGLAAETEIVLQRGHEGEITAVVYSPNGSVLASSGLKAIRLWDREHGDLIGTLTGHAERVVGLAFSPDGRWLASSSTDGAVYLWDYRGQKRVHRFLEHAGNWARRVAFSPDSKLLVAATYDGKVSLWDVVTGTVVRTLPVGERVVDIAFTADGESVITASREDDGALIRFWDVATGVPGMTLDHGASLVAIAVSQDGRLLASSGTNALVNLWELPSGRLLRQVKTPTNSSPWDVDLSADGRLLAATSQWVNWVWETQSGALVCELPGHEDGQISFSGDRREVAVASVDASVRLFDARQGSLTQVFPGRPPHVPVTSLAFSADGKYEALGMVDGRVRVWDGGGGSFKHDFRGHEGAVQALGFSADGAWLFSSSADRTMRVWDLEHGILSMLHPSFDRGDAMGALAVGGTKRLIATASGPFASDPLEDAVKLWSSHYDRPFRILKGHSATVRSVAFTPDSDLLASASADGVVKVWNAVTGACLRTLTDPMVTDTLTFAPGAQWLAAGMGDGRVRLLAPETLTTLREWQAHERSVQSLDVSSDGQWIATASGDRSVVVWEAATGNEVRRFTGITAQYLPLAFHPKKPILAFAQRDDTIVHVSVPAGQTLLQRVLFPDGEWLAWDPAKMFYMASPGGDEHARVRFSDQVHPVYPLELYRGELRRTTLEAFAAPAPLLEPKRFGLWWHHYRHKRVWLVGLLLVVVVWTAGRLRKGWIAERRRRAQETISRQLLGLQEVERKRLAGELHDSLGQNLLIIKNRLYLAQQDADRDSSRARMDEISDTVSQAIQEVREISHDLRPYQLDRLGLTKAVAAVIKKVADSGALSIKSQIAPIDGVFTAEGEIQFYRILQESLNNMLKHASAATAFVCVQQTEDRVLMKIEDDGCGFDYRHAMAHPEHSSGFGLTGLGERTRLLHGKFACDSSPGQGTRLTFEFPTAISSRT